MGLQFCLRFRDLDPKGNGSYSLARVIRERRLDLVRLGLENEMKAALTALTKSEPPISS